MFASNLINSVNTTTTFIIMAKVTGLKLYVPKVKFEKGEEFIAAVKIMDGTAVTMDLEFGDGSTKITKLITDATGGLFVNTTHK